MALTTRLKRGVATCQTRGSQSSSTTTGQSGCRANGSRGWRVCGAGPYAKDPVRHAGLKPRQRPVTSRNLTVHQRALHRIVIVGGGAVGLELATKLGNRVGKRGKVQVAPVIDEDGNEITPQRASSYDTLVIAVGSLTNDFGTPGVKEHAIALETPSDAARFHRRLVNALMRAHAQPKPLRPEQLQVAIIGAGATGVELAAELHNTTRELVAYGLDRIDPDADIKLNVIEAAERILPALPQRLSDAATKLLQSKGVRVCTSARVAEVLPNGVRLASGQLLSAELVVWAAGVKAPDFLRDLDGLETNRANQLIVKQTLQTTRDENIFAIGDCAACPWPGKDANVPPRAQAAHQQATHMVRQIANRIAGRRLRPYRYRDFGSLVSLGEYTTVGNLMGALVGGSMMIEGYIARLMYTSLYKTHELALHGYTKVALDTLARLITRRTEPHVKLH